MTSLHVLQNSVLGDEDEAGPDLPPKLPKPTSGAFTFRLRVALRSTASTQQSTDEEEEEEEDGLKDKRKSILKEAEQARRTKGVRRVKFKGELAEVPVTLPTHPEDRGSDSAEEVPDSFLSKREQNIKANKAMVNGGFTFLLNQDQSN